MGGAGAGTGWSFRGRLRMQGDTGPRRVPERSNRGERWAMRRPHPTPFFPVLPRPSFCLWSMWGGPLSVALHVDSLMLTAPCGWDCFDYSVQSQNIPMNGILLILWVYWYILLSALGILTEAGVLFIFLSGGCIWGLLSGQALSTNVHHDNFYIENCLCYFSFSL